MGNKKSKSAKTINDKIKLDKCNDANQKDISKVVQQDESIIEVKTSKMDHNSDDYDKCIETHIACGIKYHTCALCFKPAHYYAKFNSYCSQCITNFEIYNVPLYCRTDEKCVKEKKHNPTQCVLCNGQYSIRQCQLCGYDLNDLVLFIAHHWTIPTIQNEQSSIQTVRICELCCNDKHLSLDPRLTIITNEPTILPILLT